MKTTHAMIAKRTRKLQAGFSLIELMIALLLGLLVTAAAGGVFISNKRVYNATETLGRIQENTRVAFEMMSRDIREAGGNPCSATAIIVNQLTPGGNEWWDGFGEGLMGFEGTTAMPGTTTGTATGNRVSGTDAIQIHLSRGGGIRVTSHSTPSAVLNVNDASTITDGQILLVCNLDYAFIFQSTGMPAGNAIQHNGGTSLNCAQEFQFEREGDACFSSGASADAGYCFVPGATPSAQCIESSNSPAYVAAVSSFQWYVGNNDRGGRSLFRVRVVNDSATSTVPTAGTREEIVEGVEDMQLEYLVNGATDYVSASSAIDWSTVTAVRIRLQMTGTRGALTGREIQGADGTVLDRFSTNVVTIRNREGQL